MGDAVDAIRLNFNPDTLVLLNVVLGLIMFGVALDIKFADFKRLIKKPIAPAVGLVAQFILLPAMTFGLTLLLGVSPSLALGMLLIGACPGGNISNFMTHLAGGNAALSVTMTAVSTVAAIFMTPINIALWGGLHPTASQLLKEVDVDPLQMLITVFMILGVPLILGLFVSHKWPHFSIKLKKPFKYSSFIFFIVFVMIAFAANWQNFLNYIHYAIFAVVGHNAVAIAGGYSLARLTRLTPYDRRAVTMEVGIQNSALGLTLIFDFFAGLGGMALIAAAWGIWHIISGLTLSSIWSKYPVEHKTT